MSNRDGLRSKMTIIMFPPVFGAYTVPNGALLPDMACQALWYYNLIGRNAYEENDLGHGIQYEHVPFTNRTDFLQLITSVADLYGVSIDAMIKFWPAVDLQARHSGIPTLPELERYRFNSPSTVRSH